MSNESTEITDEDIQNLIERGDEVPYNPVLRVWREVLKPAHDELVTKVTPAWANRVVTAYQCISYGDMEDYRDSYFSKLLELEAVLDAEIATDDECLAYDSPEDDIKFNSTHYKNLLTNWQLAIMQWELDWHTCSPTAAVDLAAISEIHKMFFGPTGITGFLDNIAFEYTEADQAALSATLGELKEGK